MLATQQLADEYFDDKPRSGNNSELVGFIIVEGKQYEIKTGDNKVGRDPDVCSIVFNNITVSKLHAVIESEGRDDTFIYDVGSTNPVKLGKKTLKPHLRYKLENGSVMTFGNLSARFVFPPETNDKCSESILQTPVSQGESSSQLQDPDLGDIFDVETQVHVPQPSTSSFKKPSDEVETFKLPNSLLSVKQKKLETPDNNYDLNEKSLSDETTKPAIFGLSTLEDSSIFSLSTQCQIDYSPSTVENSNKTTLDKDNGETDNLKKEKSPLNDGLDDILCTFMSALSPNRKDESTPQKVVIKTEPVTDSEEIFNAQTEIEPEFVPKNSVIEKEIAPVIKDCQKDDNLHEELLEQDEIDSSQNQVEVEKQIPSTSFSNKPNENSKTEELREELEKEENLKEIFSEGNYDEGFTQARNEEEDLVETQKFCEENNSKSTEPQFKVNDASSKDPPENSDTESCLEISCEESPKFDIKKTDISDFTFPVKFMDFEEVKKNSIHLFHSDFRDRLNKISIKQESDVNDDDNDKDVRHDNDEDDTESFLEISLEDLTQKNEGNDSKKQPEDGDKDVEEGNSSENKNSEKLARTQCGSAIEDNFDEDDDFEDFIATQEFVNVKVKTATPNSDDDETQIYEPPTVQNSNDSKNKLLNVLQNESSLDLIIEEDKEDFIATQPFKEESCDVKSSKVFPEGRSKTVESKNGEVVSVLESSDDETEVFSKLEVGRDEPSFNPVGGSSPKLKGNDANSVDHENKSTSLLSEENDGSNSSYVFQLEGNNQEKETVENVQSEKETESWKENKPPVDSDSDATDCEEIEMIQSKMKTIPIKEEVMEEETQVLTLTLPENFEGKQFDENEDGWMRGNESPKFELAKEPDEANHEWSHLSLEIPSTQELEGTVEKTVEKVKENVSDESKETNANSSTHTRTPVGTKKTESESSSSLQTITVNKSLFKPEERETTRLFDSPVKRNREKDCTIEVVPVKKSRTSTNETPSSSREESSVGSTQKLLSKLWKAHDIAHIQPTRTRNSSKKTETIETPKENNKATDSIDNNETPKGRRSVRVGSANKRQKIDVTPNIQKKIEEAKKSFQSERRRSSNRLTERFSKEQKPEPSPIRVLRSTRRNSCSSMRVNNSFDYSGSSSLEKNISNSRRNSRTVDKSHFIESNINVVFTGFDCESLEKVINDLGGMKSNDLSSGTVVVADKVRRTVKFLCAIGLGLPITSPQWLWLCKKANKFLNPWNHLLKEQESEEKWDFDLRESLERSKKKKLLEGYSVFATENAKPPVNELLCIVECCGGIPLPHQPEKWPKKTIVVSCVEDKNSWPSSKLRNVKIVHYEFILSGVLRQKIDFKSFQLR